VGYHGNTTLHRPAASSHRISVIFYLTKIAEPKRKAAASQEAAEDDDEYVVEAVKGVR